MKIFRYILSKTNSFSYCDRCSWDNVKFIITLVNGFIQTRQYFASAAQFMQVILCLHGINSILHLFLHRPLHIFVAMFSLLNWKSFFFADFRRLTHSVHLLSKMPDEFGKSYFSGVMLISRIGLLFFSKYFPIMLFLSASVLLSLTCLQSLNQSTCCVHGSSLISQSFRPHPQK